MKRLQNIEDVRQILILDALRYSFLLEANSYKILIRTLRSVEKTTDKNNIDNKSLTAIGSAWQIIDSVYRISGLIQKVTNLKIKTPEILLFLNRIKDVEAFRHLHQHLDTEIHKITGVTNPILGVLSWVTKDPEVTRTIALGSFVKGIEACSMPYDRHKQAFAHNLLFSVANRSIDLENIHTACVEMAKFLEQWLKSQKYLSKKKNSTGVMLLKLAPGVFPRCGENDKARFIRANVSK